MAKKIKERLRKIRISLISLVDDPANKFRAVFKSKDGAALLEFRSIAKMNDQGLLTSLIYIPEVADTDGQGASKEEILDACHNYPRLMKGSGIDIMHDGEPVDKEEAHLCENFIVQKGDPRFQDVVIDGERVDATGSWATVMKLNSERLRAPYRTGAWTGLSMYGSALVETVAKSESFPEALASRLGKTSTTMEIEMDETKLAELLAKSLAPVIEEVKKIAQPKAEVTPTPTTETPVIKFTGDADKLADIEAHEIALFKASLDFSNPEDLAKWKAHLAKKEEIKKKADGDGDSADDGDSDELKIAKARVIELTKASNQAGDDVKSGKETTTERVARIRKSAKATVNSVLVAQGRRKATA